MAIPKKTTLFVKTTASRVPTPVWTGTKIYPDTYDLESRGRLMGYVAAELVRDSVEQFKARIAKPPRVYVPIKGLPWGNLIIAGSQPMAYYINLGGYGTMPITDMRLVEIDFKVEVAAYKAWADWTRTL